jgi:serine/threonine protein kinase
MNDRLPDLNWTVPRPGEIVAGKYMVEGPCGRGGLAAVLSAMHVGLDQRVALKVLLPQWAGDAAIVERFLREGRAATSIRSEHVIRVFDVGTLESGAPYLVLEYLDGHNLDDVVTMWGPLPIATAVDWVLQAAEAIAEAHALGIVHRDIKPANLFLTKRADGSSCIKVIDFGLSKITDPKMRGALSKVTQPKEVFGSPHYMAPEQLRAACDAGAPADLWSLGAVLHELLTGRPPFHGETMPEICATVLTEAPPPVTSLRPGIPAAIETAVLRCLQKEPGDRFGSVAEFAAALAPFGTLEASESRARIERVLDRARTSDPSFPAMLALPPWPEVPDENSSAYLVQPAAPASLRVVLGGLLVLGALAVATLMGLHSLVQTDQRPVRDLAVAEMQTPPSASGNGASPRSTTPDSADVPSALPERGRAWIATALAGVLKTATPVSQDAKGSPPPSVSPQAPKAPPILPQIQKTPPAPVRPPAVAPAPPPPQSSHRNGSLAVVIRPAQRAPAAAPPGQTLPFLTLPSTDTVPSPPSSPAHKAPEESASAPLPGRGQYEEGVSPPPESAAPGADDSFEGRK